MKYRYAIWNNFAFAKCEIKFASKHLRSKYFIRFSVFHSEAISLAEGEFHWKRKDKSFDLSFFFWDRHSKWNRSKNQRFLQKIFKICFRPDKWSYKRINKKSYIKIKNIWGSHNQIKPYSKHWHASANPWRCKSNYHSFNRIRKCGNYKKRYRTNYCHKWKHGSFYSKNSS